ncbi:unnamed protein product [Peniophora sp. CBMAI 1063]|nr:unnamed protein product [Peniophora sp. CBMAI 1063]
MVRYAHYTAAHPTLSPAQVAHNAQVQAAESLPRYHYLRAAVTGAYDLEPSEDDPSLTTLNFARYAGHDLVPLYNLRLQPNADGSMHPEDLQIYNEELFMNWKAREGGILCTVRLYKQFWSMVLSYNSPARTTGSAARDALFDGWRGAGFPEAMIPCMWFARPCGCMDPECQYKHDEETTRRDKDSVYAWRRAQCNKLTAADVATFRDADPITLSPGDDGYIVRQIQLDMTHPEPNICWNPACPQGLNVHPDASRSLQWCSICKVVSYCSKGCQRRHWRAHKGDCHPYEEIIANDDLWSIVGRRKGLQKNGMFLAEENGNLSLTVTP